MSAIATTRWTTTRALRGLAIASVLAGCANSPKDDSDERAHDRASASETPLLVSVSGKTIQSGFYGNPLKEQRDVDGFRITKHPVTWKQFDACTKAGACDSADGSACSDSAYAPHAGYDTPDFKKQRKNAPAVCVGEAQAEAFCSWIGGRLPTPDQWLLAARGETPHRYSWGDEPSSCTEHVMSPQLLAHYRQVPGGMAPPVEEEDEDACENEDIADDATDVGKHEAGSSPSGVEDVLLTPAELLSPDEQSMFNACGHDDVHCVVFGVEPAEIDSVEPFYAKPASGSKQARDARLVAHAYGFRCVLPQKGKAKS